MKGKMMEKMTPAQHKKMMGEKDSKMAPPFKKGAKAPAGKGAVKPKGRPF